MENCDTPSIIIFLAVLCLSVITIGMPCILLALLYFLKTQSSQFEPNTKHLEESNTLPYSLQRYNLAASQ